jgi:hypothetical protein
MTSSHLLPVKEEDKLFPPLTSYADVAQQIASYVSEGIREKQRGFLFPFLLQFVAILLTYEFGEIIPLPRKALEMLEYFSTFSEEALELWNHR